MTSLSERLKATRGAEVDTRAPPPERRQRLSPETSETPRGAGLRGGGPRGGETTAGGAT